MTSLRLSVIVQFFNRRNHVEPIAKALTALTDAELIVCDDGSIDGSHGAWASQLCRENHVLIRSNDIHEIRSYDRAASLASGDVLCFLQDDDMPPSGDEWTRTALALFAKHDRLGILGGFKGYEFTTGGVGENGEARIIRRLDRPEFTDPALGVPFMYVQAVNLAPMFIRRQTYAETGFALGFSQPGESGILFDQEICFRAWLPGSRVALYEAPFTRRVGGRGTLIYSRESRERNFEANLARLARAYGGQFAAIASTADGLNHADLGVPVADTVSSPAPARCVP